MNKFLCFLLLVCLYSQSYGSQKWIYISEPNHDPPNDGIKIYFDLENSRFNGGFVYFYILHDYSRKRMNGEMSLSSYIKGECGELKVKYLSTNYFKKPMGEELMKVVSVNDEWSYTTPGYVDHEVLKIICSHRER